MAIADLEKKYGKPANRRFVMFCCWLAETGTGLVLTPTMLAACRRIRVTGDLEVECDRFELSRGEAVKKYKYIDRPEAPLVDKLAMCVDCLCRCALGVADGAPVPEADVPLVAVILNTVFVARYEGKVGASGGAEVEAMVNAAITGRSERNAKLTTT